MKWKGAPELKPLVVPIDTLALHPDNPRRGDLGVIAESLRVHGQLKPIVVNKARWRVKLTGHQTIVAGNHTRRAAEELLGWDHIAALAVSMEPVRERQFLLADNRASDQADYHVEALAKILKELEESGALDGSGYDPPAAAAIVAQLDRIAASAPAPAATVRQRHVGQGQQEFRILLDIDRAGRFNEYLRMLRKEWGKTLPQDEIVYRAVEEAARAL